MRALDLRAGGELELSEQDDGEATYAEKIDPSERRLDLSRPAVELARVVRALHPHIGAYLELAGGERLGVLAARAERRPAGRPARSIADGEIVVGCATER